MIGTLIRISLLNLRRDKVAFMLTFVLPIIFFSIFAMIFGATDRATKDTKIKIVVADRDQTDTSRRFIRTLHKQDALEVNESTDETSARKQVHDGTFAVAVILLRGFTNTFGDFSSEQDSIELVYDASNPIAKNAVAGLLQATAFTSAPDILIEKGFASMEPLGAGLTPQQTQVLKNLQPYLRGDRPWGDLNGNASSVGSGSTAAQGMLKVRGVDVRAGESAGPEHSMIAYYVAGVGVMFMLFSMAGAGGALLDEIDSGTLERLLSTNASMSLFLMAKWLFLTAVGIAQISIMFLWAAFVFHLDLFTAPHVAGFVAMAIPTAAAAAGFGLVLAALCKTRAQLSGVSTVVILIMSALGGSMVPRFIMPKFMETTALFTFNGWALDGFLKVFWYADPHATASQTLASLIPQLSVLAFLAVAFLTTARFLAKRWETV